MNLPLALYLARRLPLRPAGKSHRGHGSGLGAAVTGIALAVAVMLTAIIVMSGFSHEIRHKVSGFEPQIAVSRVPVDGDDGDSDGNGGLLSVAELDPARALLPPGTTMAPTVRQPAIMKSPVNFQGVVIKGVDAAYDWEFIASSLTAGAVPDYSCDSTLYHILLSQLTATALGVVPGDKIDTWFVAPGDTYKVRRLKVAGIFDTHFTEYDRSTVYGSLAMLQRLAGVDSTACTVVEINGFASDSDIDRTEQRLNTLLTSQYMERGGRGPAYSVANIHRTAAMFYSWLDLLDTNVGVVLGIMALLSLLTLVSSLFIIILRHVPTIGLLKAMGAGNRLIRTTFIIMAMRVLVPGLALGNVLALGLALGQRATQVLPLDPDAYYLDHVPVLIDWTAVASLNATVILLALAGMLLPSALISGIAPSRAIRYE